tara:strand:- start:632 stop:784 length:153 start_codon:yes stop_codon:yes gene_type:complete
MNLVLVMKPMKNTTTALHVIAFLLGKKANTIAVGARRRTHEERNARWAER